MWRLAIALLVAVSAAAQTPNCDSTVLPIRVMGIGSHPATEVEKQLHVFLDGHEIASSRVQYGTMPRNTYILLDASRSMKESRLWSIAQDVVRQIVALTPDGDVKVAVFDRDLSKFVGRDEIASNGLAPFKEFVETDQKRGTTSLFDAVAASVRAPRNATPDDIIVLVTDGGDNTSVTRPDKLLREVLVDQARVFAVLILPSLDPNVPERLRAEDVVDIIQKSGGDVLPLFSKLPSWVHRKVDPSGVALERAAVETWYTGARSAFYVQLPATPHRAKVKVELSPKIKNARVLYPRELPACTPRP